MADLFPAIEPHAQGMLPVGDGHAVFWEVSGRPDGMPVVFLHGGPGAGTSPVHRRFFDPLHWRIILFDQRGCGQSLPHGETRANTTPHLLADLERLRLHLGLEKWLLFGGSWGASLALAYAIEHPERCIGLVLRGVFLCRRFEIDWFLYGMKAFFPDVWRDFAHFVPENERHDLLQAYWSRLTAGDPSRQAEAAHAWCLYEARCSSLLPQADGGVAWRGPSALSLARMEAHYFRNAMFMPENHLIDQAHRLTGIPGRIIQGRYDVICPMESADQLARAWPDCRLITIPDAGHSAMEPGIRRALVNAVEEFKTKS